MNFIPLINRNFTNQNSIGYTIPIPTGEKKLNARAKIDTGKFCNADCDFCYYSDQLNSKKFLTPEKAKEIGQYLIDNGITEFELSGGEPTISKYFIGILKVLSDLQKENNLPQNISVVTNGHLFGSIHEKKLKDAQLYVKEWLISIHGYLHDHNRVVRANKNYYPFEDIACFIRRNIQDNSNTLIRVNIVVTPETINQSEVDKFIDYLIYLSNNDIQLNFLPLNYWGDAQKKITSPEAIFNTYKFINLFFERYGQRPIVASKNIAKMNPLKSRLVNIRYAQMCLLETDYARSFVVSHTDHIFDLNDWNKVFYPKDFEEEDNNVYQPEDYYSLNTESKRKRIIKDLSYESQINAALRDQEYSHIKDGTCTLCKYFLKCDGVKKEEYHLNKGNSDYRKQFIKKGNIDESDY